MTITRGAGDSVTVILPVPSVVQLRNDCGGGKGVARPHRIGKGDAVRRGVSLFSLAREEVAAVLSPGDHDQAHGGEIFKQPGNTV